MPNKRRVHSAVSHARIVRDPRSPYWYAEFEVDAERFHKSTRQRDEAMAQAVADRWYDEAVAAAARRCKTGIEPMRLWEAASAWWEHVRFGNEPDLGPFSDDPRYADRPIKQLVRVIGWDKYVHDVWNPDLQRLIDDRRRDVKRSGVDGDGNPLFKPITVRTINRTTTRLLRRVLFFARDNHGQALHDPPIIFGKFLKGQMKEKKRPPRVISPREALTLKKTERPDLTPLREFAALSTLRLDECLITWPQVDFATRKIRLVQKGGEWREIDITPAIERILRPLKEHHETPVFTWESLRTRKCPRTGQKFIKGKRYPWTYWGVSSARRRDWPKAGINANFHDLRRTGAEYMRAAGVPIDVYSKQLGHSDIKTTQLCMGDLSPEQLAGSAIQRDAWLEAVTAKIEQGIAEKQAAGSKAAKAPVASAGKSGRYKYYMCCTKARQGKTGCKGQTVPMERLDTIVAEHIEQRLLQPKRLEQILSAVLLRRKEQAERRTAHIAELRKRAAESEARLKRLYEAIENGVADVSGPMLKEHVAELRSIRDQARTDAERAEGALDRLDRPSRPRR